MKKYIKYIVIILVLVVAIIAWGKIKKNKNAPEWRMESPSQGSIREVVTATGSLNPYVLVNVGTEVSGKIEKIYKDFNDRVKKGELLAKLDTELLRTSLEATRGDLAKATTAMNLAKLDYDLQTQLFEKNMTPEYDLKKARYSYETAQQNHANAQLSLQKAQKNLDNAFITSPIDGIIVSRSVDEGQTVAASLNSPTLFVIANNLDQMQITASVDEADIGKIKVGQIAEFNVDAHPSSRFQGTVKQVRLNPTTESNVVTYSVIIDAQNPDHRLLPGMTSNVTIVIQAKENAMRIPETATRFRPSKEIWESFGLKWDDELLNAGRKAMQEAMQQATAQKPATETKQPSAQTSQSGTKQPAAQTPQAGTRSGNQANIANLPDSIKAKIAARQQGNQAMPSGRSGQGGFNMGGAFSPRSRFAVVWVMDDKTPKPIVIKTGVSDGANVEVLEGIEANASLITGVIFKDPKQANSATSPTGPGMGRRF